MCAVFLPLWYAIQQVTPNITNFFSGIQDAVSQITNTGQGLFSGLASAGSFIWKAITDFGNWLYGGIIYFTDRFKEGMEWVAKHIGGAFTSAFYYLASGVSWLGNQIYSFGTWIYNSLIWLGLQVKNAIEGVINWLIARLKDIWDTVGSWYSSIVDYVNSWLSNLMVSFRRKLKQTIVADLTIYGIWKSMERMTQAESGKEIPLAFGKALAMPIFGVLVAEVVDKIVPMPSTQYIEFIPKIPWTEFKYSPISISVPAEKPTPTTPAIPTMPTITKPVNDTVGEIKGSVEYVFPLFVGNEVGGEVKGEAELISPTMKDAVGEISGNTEFSLYSYIRKNVEGEIEGYVEKTVTERIEADLKAVINGSTEYTLQLTIEKEAVGEINGNVEYSIQLPPPPSLEGEILGVVEYNIRVPLEETSTISFSETAKASVKAELPFTISLSETVEVSVKAGLPFTISFSETVEITVS